jgi:hypothetical protein
MSGVDSITSHKSGKKLTQIATKNSTVLSDTKPKEVFASQPKFYLVGRIAGGLAGYVGGVLSPDLHFTVIIEDANGKTTGIDGQPTTDLNFSTNVRNNPVKDFKMLRTNFYWNEMPSGIKIKIPLEPPAGMSGFTFKQELMKKAYAFASYSLDYSLPKNINGRQMNRKEYNSSSYVAGLLNSVMGYVPKISTPGGYQTPGWETPIPASYFKGEAMR